MNLIKLIGIDKNYAIDKKHSFKALKHISLELPPNGLVSIVGKSGSGKSTLLNILAGLDDFDKGRYLFNGKDINKLNKEEKLLFRNQYCGIIFQHYNLLEDETALYNIILPSLINGQDETSAVEDALMLIEKLNIDKSILEKRVKDLSGGEKQRIAILRSLINSPNVIFCDEPTGALDSINSIKVMELLKKVSATKLVVVVSHNKELIDKYSSRIIEINEGKIVKDELINEVKNKSSPISKNVPFRNSSKWCEHFIKNNIKKKKSRNIFLVTLSAISLLASHLIISFIYGSNKSLINEGYKHIDYGVISIAKEEKIELEKSFISLTKSTRPDINLFNEFNIDYKNIIFINNYDIISPSSSSIFYNEEKINDLLIKPIYDLSDKYINHDLFIEKIDYKNDFNEIIINKKARDLLQNSLKINPIGQYFKASYYFESNYYTFDNLNTVITDSFILDKEFKIVGVVDELEFLSTPTIYYSYKGLINYIENYKLNNLSTYLKEDINWKSRIDKALEDDELSGYSIKCFIPINYYQDIKKIIDEIKSYEVEVTSLPLTINESYSSILFASSSGLIIFFIIAIVGVILIFGILSLFNFSQDLKKNAILITLGASKENIIYIYLFESIFIGIIAFGISLGLTYPFIYLINFILGSVLHLNNLLMFPLKLLAFRFDYFLTIFIAVILIISLSTIIPILFNSKISLAKELKEDD